MIIALFPNLQKPQSYDLAMQARDFFRSKGVLVTTADQHAELFDVTPISAIAQSDITLAISLGGDGSILNFVHAYPEIEAPVMGINLGSLGFLADVPTFNLTKALEEILAGSYSVQERLVIESHTNDTYYFAINEVVIHRGENYTLVDLAIFVDGKYLNTFSADGIIISTPSGSTAYSLSAGGPILTPQLEAVVITPICPHTITNRPIVLQHTHTISIRYLNNYLPVSVAFDGIQNFPLQPQESISIGPAKKRFRLATLSSVDYFETLRTKLGWSGTLKN
ncbi:MAG: NAD(+)/NADH kinase [Verrucomicrobia bacterium]|nr:NAD(+)/NADH kinase [Verrucomicrobiota bacterium]